VRHKFFIAPIEGFTAYLRKSRVQYFESNEKVGLAQVVIGTFQTSILGSFEVKSVGAGLKKRRPIFPRLLASNVEMKERRGAAERGTGKEGRCLLDGGGGARVRRRGMLAD
jgi:hypothetical protein